MAPATLVVHHGEPAPPPSQCTIWPRRRRRLAPKTTPGHRGRGQVPRRHGRVHHRRPLLQGYAAANGTHRGRWSGSGSRLPTATSPGGQPPAGSRSTSPSRSRWRPARRTWPPITHRWAGTRRRGVLHRRRDITRVPCDGPRQWHRRGNASIATALAVLPDQTFDSQTTGSTSYSSPAPAPTPPRRPSPGGRQPAGPPASASETTVTAHLQRGGPPPPPLNTTTGSELRDAASALVPGRRHLRRRQPHRHAPPRARTLAAYDHLYRHGQRRGDRPARQGRRRQRPGRQRATWSFTRRRPTLGPARR